MNNTIRAGRISGDPAKGLCERICIEVPRVFDGCRESFDNQTFVLELTGISPQAVPPFTFVEATNYGEIVFENVSVVSLTNGRSRISGDIVIPILVTFTDANGDAYTGTSTVRQHREVILRIPERSVVPYRIEVFAAFLSRVGNFVSDTAVSVQACYTYIIKIIVMTDILVPIYGTAVYPDCVECGGNVCNAFLSLPLFAQT